jgi:putative spermidine/putrescine transport system substrate-binding protein
VGVEEGGVMRVAGFRRVQILALVFVITLLGAACGNDEQTPGEGGKFAGRTLTFMSWGGAYQEAETKAYIEPWEELTGATVVQEGPTDYAKIQAQVEAGSVTLDVIDTEPNFAISACEAGQLVPIDTEIVDTSNIVPELMSECGFPNMQFAYSIGYNTEAFSEDNHPREWADFWDTENFPGKREFWLYVSGGALEAALIADGVPPEEVYPLDEDRALDKLCEIKDETIWYETGEQQAQNIATGEAAMGQVWNGRIYDIKVEGQPGEVDFNQYLATYDTFVVPEGSENVDMAMDLINYVASPEAQRALTDYISYAPTNTEAFTGVNEEAEPYLSTTPENLEQRALIMDYEYWAENYDRLSNKFNDWLTSGC